MNFKDFINSVQRSENKRRDTHTLEIVITKILEKYIKDQDKRAYIEYREVLEFDNQRKRIKYHDIFAPDGIRGIEGPTSFEIKAVRSKRVLYPLLQNSINLVYDSAETENIIYIFTFELSKEEKEEAILMLNKFIEKNADLNRFKKSKKIYLWGLEELNEIFENYSSLYESLFENINVLLFKDTVEKGLREETSENETLNNQQYIENLKERYKNDDLVLFVGAGISKDAGIAMWDTLIYELLVSLINKELEEKGVNLTENEQTLIIESIKKGNGNSPLQLVRYIRYGLNEIFQKTLTEILYKDSKIESHTLTAITNLCTPIRNGIGIQGVVTYNFDDLLEKNFTKSRIAHRSIYKEAEIPTKNEIGIFHVHGFLPSEENNYSNLKESLLVFSEEGYHDLLSDAYHWANLVQLNYLRERTCLFIGVSLTDPNIRRLLEINMKKQPESMCRHYLILKKEQVKSTKAKVNMKNIEKFQEVNQALKEASLKELGINVIWVENYENDIPAILKGIKK